MTRPTNFDELATACKELAATATPCHPYSCVLSLVAREHFGVDDAYCTPETIGAEGVSWPPDVQLSDLRGVMTGFDGYGPEDDDLDDNAIETARGYDLGAECWLLWSNAVSPWPTYRIPAEQVVPGMILVHEIVGIPDRATSTVTFVERRPGDRVAIHDDVGGPWYPLDQLVPVQLPGPSPRELLCTCLMLGLHGGWHVEHDPAEHADDCPVAPNADRSRGPAHGGLRLWPANATWYDHRMPHEWYAVGWPWPMDRIELRETLRGTSNVEDDAVELFLMAFCCPPAQPEIKP